ncbi:MAG TPA: hypothetical protein VNG11_04560 [Chloroflexota bacterium]|nr:hypothetical protein [Chloroflexota bacterium]
MLVFKHEAVLTFVGRLVHDREFCEWFAAEPFQALSSHGLSVRDLEDLNDVLRTDRHQPEVAAAMQPLVEVLVKLFNDSRQGIAASTPDERISSLNAELHQVRDRLAVARRQPPRPWWKFW